MAARSSSPKYGFEMGILMLIKGCRGGEPSLTTSVAKPSKGPTAPFGAPSYYAALTTLHDGSQGLRRSLKPADSRVVFCAAYERPAYVASTITAPRDQPCRRGRIGHVEFGERVCGNDSRRT